MAKTGKNRGAGEGLLSVLVVDDETTIGKLIGVVLRPDGYRVTALSCAKEACAELARRDYDCIVCDWRMPGMSGREFYDHVSRAKPHLAERIIFMTGDYAGMGAHGFLAREGRPWLKKPFRIGQLKAALKGISEEESAR